MNKPAKKLLTDLVKEEKTLTEIKTALISHGYGTEGIEGVYEEVVEKLGITSPADPAPPTIPADPALLNTEAKQYATEKPMFDLDQMLRNAIRLLAGLLVIVAVYILYVTFVQELVTKYFDASNDNDVSASDLVMQGQLETLKLAADRYQRRLLDYGGLCKGIYVDTEKFYCRATTDAYAIAGPLTTGQYYCVDSTGFSGAVSREPRGERCQ